MKTYQPFAKLTLSVLSILTLANTLSPQSVEARHPEVGQDSFSQSTDCTDATIKGAYGYIDWGFQGNQAPFVPYNAVRTANFDGNGNFQGQGYLSLSGHHRDSSFQQPHYLRRYRRL